jgi:hypothetical protein
VREPSALAMTVGLPPSITATTEFVVPKSIPIVFAIFLFSCIFHALYNLSIKPFLENIKKINN